MQAFWLDMMCGEKNWDVLIEKGKDKKIVAVWPYLKKRKFGLNMIGQPMLTQHLGPHLIYPHNIQKRERIISFENKILSSLQEQMDNTLIFKQGFGPEIRNWLPFYWAGYKQTTRYTYVLNEIKQEELIWSGLKSSVKTDIRNAEKKYIVRKEKDVNNLFELNQSTFQRKDQKLPFSLQKLKEIYHTTQTKTGSEIHTIFENDIAVASMLVVFDYRKAYSLLIGVNKDLNPKGAVQLLLWEGIKSASKKVDIFDFEGSMIQEVESVFRAFGGTMTPYFIISKAPAWFRFVFKLFKGKEF